MVITIALSHHAYLPDSQNTKMMASMNENMTKQNHQYVYSIDSFELTQKIKWRSFI